MSIRPIHLAALVAAFALGACASGGSKSAAPAPSAAAADTKAAPSGSCTTCTVEVENRFDYDVLIYDRRATQNQVGEIRHIGKALAKQTVSVTTNGRPNLGMAIAQDNGMPKTAKDVRFCRQVPVAPGSKADYHYACGN